MEFPSIKDLDVTSEDMDNCPPGMTLSIMPHCREYMADPMWFDQIGRDPIHARKIFQRSARGELTRDDLKIELAGVLDEWPRYGPAVFQKAAKEGRAEVVEVLIEMGVKSDPKTMKNRDDNGDAGEKDADYGPSLEPEHAYLTAIVNGHLDIVKMLVEKGGVPVNYEDAEDGSIHIAYAIPNAEMLRWLLDHGATMTLEREDGINDIESAIKRGSLECLNMLLSHPQAVAASTKIKTEDLRLAASSGNDEMVRYVLQSDCFGVQDPGTGVAGRGLDDKQRDAISESLCDSSRKSVNLSKLLMKQLTPTRPDGSFEPFLIPDSRRMQIYNATQDILEERDDPELLQLLWDTVLHQPPSQESIDKLEGHPPQEALNRLLISTAAMGHTNTVKILLEKYNADINHVSHKYFTTPLSRVAASGRNPLPGRLETVEYLRSRPDINLELACSDYCNGATPLALTVQQACIDAKQKDMVRLLLKLGGPVDEVDPDLRQLADNHMSDDPIEVHVLWAESERRKPVTLSDTDKENCTSVVLEYSARELRLLLRNIKIRSDDETLKHSDPKGRPLMLSNDDAQEPIRGWR